MTYKLNNLNVASLDFDNIKESLISFLEQQQDLKDLDFRNEASSVNLLLNILSTVTAYNGVYAQFGFVNSFATTTSLLESVLGIASNSSVLVAPTQSARSTRTVIASGATLADYSTFKARATNGADIFFFNTEEIPNKTAKIVTLFSGNEVLSFTNYNYDNQSCVLPANIDPATVNMYEKSTTSSTITKWTRVDKSATTTTGNNTHFTVVNGPNGYLVTNNFASSRKITTSSTVMINAIVSNGSIGNNATISSRSDTQFGTTPLPSDGYDTITVDSARSKLLFKATGQERCVTIQDFKNAIMSSGIEGTKSDSDITVANGSYPGQVKIYVNGLSTESAEKLMSYLSEKSIAGISLTYSL